MFFVGSHGCVQVDLAQDIFVRHNKSFLRSIRWYVFISIVMISEEILCAYHFVLIQFTPKPVLSYALFDTYTELKHFW